MRCRSNPTKWPLKEIPQQFLFKNNLNGQHPLFAHPMGLPTIVPLISPDLMVKNLPAAPPPPSIHIVSDSQVSMNLNPDVPEFIPRSSSVELKTEDNCDTNDCEQIKKVNNQSSTINGEYIESSNDKTTSNSENIETTNIITINSEHIETNNEHTSQNLNFCKYLNT